MDRTLIMLLLYLVVFREEIDWMFVFAQLREGKNYRTVEDCPIITRPIVLAPYILFGLPIILCGQALQALVLFVVGWRKTPACWLSGINHG